MQQLRHSPHPTHLRGSAARWGRGCRCVGTSRTRKTENFSPTRPQSPPAMGPLAPGEAAKSFTGIFHLSSSSLSYCVSGNQRFLRKGRWMLGCDATKMITANSKARSKLGADELSPVEEAVGSHFESLTYLTRSLDVQVVEPFQDRNSGHHPNGRVMKVAVQHLNYSIQVQGHLDPLRAAWKGERLVQCCNVQLTPPMVGRSTTHQRLHQTSQLNP